MLTIYLSTENKSHRKTDAVTHDFFQLRTHHFFISLTARMGIPHLVYNFPWYQLIQILFTNIELERKLVNPYQFQSVNHCYWQVADWNDIHTYTDMKRVSKRLSKIPISSSISIGCKTINFSYPISSACCLSHAFLSSHAFWL